MNVTDLKVAGSIAAGGDATDSFTPASGEEVAVKAVHVEMPSTVNMEAKLIWKFEHGSETEEVIWIFRQSGSLPFEHVINGSDVDGVRKLGILVENNELVSPQGASALARIWHEVK